MRTPEARGESVVNKPEIGKPEAPQILTPVEFVADFAREARSAKQRVWLQCMDFEMKHATGIVQNALRDAASRGVDTRLTYDTLAVSMVDGSISWLTRDKEKRESQEAMSLADEDVFEALQKAGVKVTITNPKMGVFFPANLVTARPFPLPGRNHTKITIIDDVVYIGGVNLASDHFEAADFMVKIKDPDVVLHLSKLFGQVNGNRPKQDLEIKCNEDYSILVDRGMPFSSLIYDEALTMIDSARASIKYLSQFPPSGKILDYMVKAARGGIRVDVVINSRENYDNIGFPLGSIMRRKDRKLISRAKKVPTINVYRFNGHLGKVHAKMIIIDSKVAMWGSHNLDKSGVQVGTQETNMVTRNKELVKALVNTFDSIRKGTFNLGYQEGPYSLPTITRASPDPA